MPPIRRNKERDRPHNQNQATPIKPTAATSSTSLPLSSTTSTPLYPSSSLIKYESDALSEKKTLEFTVKKMSTLIEMAKISEKNNGRGNGCAEIDSLKFIAGDSIQMSSTWEICLQYGKAAPKTSNSAENNNNNGAGTTPPPPPSSSEGFGIFLHLSDYKGNSNNVFVKYNLSLKLANGNTYRSWMSPMKDWKPSTNRSWGWRDWMTPEELRNSKVIVNDAFTIYLDFTIHAKTGMLTTPAPPAAVENEKSVKVDKGVRDEFTRQFAMFLEDGTCSDFNIKIPKPGGKRTEFETFKVHKVILAARSSVFKAMVEANMQETKTREVVITDVSPLAMKILLKFIYTCILDDEWILTAEEVILAADKYQLATMKDMCEKNFAQVLTPSNALQMMKLSKILNLQKASKLVKEYVKSNVSEIYDESQ